MELLWACMQDGSGVSADIAKAALCRIEEIIRTRAYRLEYLDQYGQMLQSRNNVRACIHLLMQLIDSFPDAPTPLEDKTKPAVIAYLNSQYALLDSFIADSLRLQAAGGRPVRRPARAAPAAQLHHHLVLLQLPHARAGPADLPPLPAVALARLRLPEPAADGRAVAAARAQRRIAAGEGAVLPLPAPVRAPRAAAPC